MGRQMVKGQSMAHFSTVQRSANLEGHKPFRSLFKPPRGPLCKALGTTQTGVTKSWVTLFIHSLPQSSPVIPPFSEKPSRFWPQRLFNPSTCFFSSFRLVPLYLNPSLCSPFLSQNTPSLALFLFILDHFFTQNQILMTKIEVHGSHARIMGPMLR